MSRKLAWAAVVAVLTIVVTLATLWNPVLIAAMAGCIVGLAAFSKVHDSWRRSFIVALGSLYAASSSVEALAAVGSIAKIGGVALLVLTTILTSQGGHKYQNRQHAALSRSLWLVAMFAGVSIVWSYARAETLFDGATLLALVFVIHRVSTFRWRDKGLLIGDIATAYWVSMTFLAIGGLGVTVGLEGTIRDGGRHQWLFNNPNMLAVMAVITLTLGIGVSLHYRFRLLWFTLAIPASAILLSQSRAALIAAIAGIAWIAIRRGAVSIILVGLLTIVGFFAIRGAEVFSRFSEEGDGLSNRTLVWNDALRILFENPLGIGWAATPTTMEYFFAIGQTQSGITGIHNSYFQAILELGFAGILPILLLVACCVLLLFRSPIDGLGAGLTASVLAGLVIQLSESVIFGVGAPYPWTYWFIVAAAAVSVKPQTPTRNISARIGLKSKTKGISL